MESPSYMTLSFKFLLVKVQIIFLRTCRSRGKNVVS